MKASELTPHKETESSQQGEQPTALGDAIHALAQPLTALSFMLDLASVRSDPESWRQAVDTGRVECRRAIAALQQVRAAATPDMQLIDQGTTGLVG